MSVAAGEFQGSWSVVMGHGSGVLATIFSAGKGQECCSGSGVLASIFSAVKGQECCSESGVLASIFFAGKDQECCSGRVCWRVSFLLARIRSAALGQVCWRVFFLLARSLWSAAGRAWCCGSVRLAVAGKVSYLIKKRTQEQNCMECFFTFSLEQVGLPCFFLCS